MHKLTVSPTIKMSVLDDYDPFASSSRVISSHSRSSSLIVANCFAVTSISPWDVLNVISVTFMLCTPFASFQKGTEGFHPRRVVKLPQPSPEGLCQRQHHQHRVAG